MNTVNTEDRSDEELIAHTLHGYSCGQTCWVPLTQHRGEARAVLEALAAAGRLREHVNAATDEQTARSIFRAWLEHCGYTADQIAVIEAEPDHSNCEFIGSMAGWDCTDAEGESNHPLEAETDEAAELITFTLEALDQAGRLGAEPVEHLITVACRATAQGVLADLVAAGRLLPEGGEERTEWEITWLDKGKEREHEYRADEAYIGREIEAAKSLGVAFVRGRRRTVTSYPDGRVLLGAWAEVPTTEGDANG